MALDAAVNFAKAALAAGYDAAATSIAVAAGQGARFGPVPFNASWWNFTDAADPADDPTVEIVRVTAIVGDTLTITRAQEGTASSNHNTAGKTYKLVAGPTAKLVADINAGCVYLNPSVAPSQTGNINVSGWITAGSGFTGDLTGNASSASAVVVADQSSSATPFYPLFSAGTGTVTVWNSTTKLAFVPSTGTLVATVFSGAGTNLTGTATSLTAGAANASLIADDNATNATMYPVWTVFNSGYQAIKVSSTKFQFNPSTALLQIKANTGTLPAVAAAGTLLQLAAVDANVTRVQLDSFGAANAYSGRRSNGTLASKTGVIADDVLCQITGTGWNSAAAYGAVSVDIRLCAAETHSATTAATYVVIRTTPTGSVIPLDRLKINPNGDLQVQGGVVANATVAGTQLYAQQPTSATILQWNGITMGTTSAATSNVTHQASPYMAWYASIWNGTAAVAKGFFLGSGGVSGANSQYTLQLGSTDVASILSIRGDTGAIYFQGVSTADIALSGIVYLREYATGGLSYLQARDDASNRNISLRIRTQKTGPTVVECATFDQNGTLTVLTSVIAPVMIVTAGAAGCTGTGWTNYGNLQFGSTIHTVAAAGGSGALPALPVGYLGINLGGGVNKIPIYG